MLHLREIYAIVLLYFFDISIIVLFLNNSGSCLANDEYASTLMSLSLQKSTVS